MGASRVSDCTEPAATDDEAAVASAVAGPVPRLAARLGLSVPPAHHQASQRVQRSRQLYEQARRASHWTPEPADTAGLLRKAIHQLIAAVVCLGEPPPSTYAESQAHLEASADLREIFADVWDDLSWLDELASCTPVSGDESDERSRRYGALLERMPAVYRAVGQLLEREQRKAGLRPRIRLGLFGAAWVAVVAVAFIVPLLVIRGARPVRQARAVDAEAHIQPGPVEPREVLDDPTRCFQATYFAMLDFQRPVVTRRDCLIEFDWGLAPVVGIPALPADGYSVRWEGVLTAPRSEAYVFYLVSDDGSRLFLDEKLIVDNWGNHRLVERVSEPIQLEAGEGHVLRVDYFEAGNTAAVQLLWSSPTIEKRSVPGRYITRPQGAPVSPQRAD
ncbi:MAG: hypothetical protein JRI68_01205 [Deltaproteobacteria bacterium]|nr:hypothetical protein [Deltaproteobacteria bacterium]